ncbi:MAG: hypothetical protein SFU27_08430 [Thermonemataceae bacterium]|nr:hypothetical protein [Thermonemataceae bacterium]
MGLLDFKNTLQQVKRDLLEKPKEALLDKAKKELLGERNISLKKFQKITEILDGYYYSKDGHFIGNIGQSDDAHIVDTDRGFIISDVVLYTNTTLKEALKKYVDKIYFSGLSNREILTFATICKIEESDRIGIFAIANAFINFLLGGLVWGYSLNDFINKKGYSSVPSFQRVPLDIKKISEGSEEKNQMSAVCNALLYYGDVGGKDYSNGATHWDGFDLAVKGKEHDKPKNQGIHAIGEHLNPYLLYWSENDFEKLKAISGKNDAKFAEGEDALTNLPIKATGKYNEGRVLYKSVAQFGGTIFWGPNYQADENIGYDWKNYYKK